MPRRKVLAFLVLMLSLSLSSAISEIVDIPLPLASVWSADDPIALRLENVLADPNADRSELPTLSWWWALEEGQILSRAELLIREESLEGGMEGEARRISNVSSEGREIPVVNEPLWSEDYRVEISTAMILHGRRYQSISICPLRLDGRRVRALRAADLRLELQSANYSDDLAKPLRPDFPLRERSLDLLGERLLNPESLQDGGDRAVGGGGFPTEAPSLDGAEVEMVIVTIDEYLGLCEDYAETKTNWGIPTVARSLTWIEEHYPQGNDRVEMIRNFARDAYEKWSIRYLLIVGDTEQVPVRYAWSTLFVQPETTPTDLYLSCLDGNWNADGDSHWAEVANGDDPGDMADLIPEIFVGRLPASNYDECVIMLGKVQTAQNCVDSSYQNRVLLLGEVLFPQEWIPGQAIHIDGASYCESVTVNAIGPEHDLTRLYENYYDYPGSSVLTRNSAFNAMEAGPSVVLHNGHGGRQNMSVGDGSLNSTLIATLENMDRLFMLYMVNCTAAAFDFNSLAESFLENPGGGTYAVIGSTRETFSNISVNYQNVFFYALYDDPSLRLGELYANSIVAFDSEAQQNTGYRWAHLTFALLGDPSSWVRYRTPIQPLVTHAGSHMAGSGPFSVTVQTPLLEPWPDISVTLRKNDEDYRRAFTDENGEVSFDLFPQTAGSYILRVDARNGLPAQSMFLVSMPTESPYLSVASMSIDDLSDGTVLGNGNGVAEAGETVRLQIQLRNEGAASADTLSAILTSNHSEVIILEDSDEYGDIPPHSNAMGLEGYLVQLGDFGDDEILPFQVQFDFVGGTQNDEFFLESADTDLALFRNELIDDTGGDGDGHLELGETAELHISLANWGRAEAPDLNATLIPDTASGVDVLSGTVNLGDVGALSRDVGPAVFSIERVTEDPPTVKLLLVDAIGRTDTLSLLLERPVGLVGAVEFEPNTDVTLMRLNWDPPEGSGIFGYRIYRSSEGEMGSFEEVTSEWTEVSTFMDSNLSPLTTYWYKVRPLSEALLLGEIPSAVQVTTSPALKDGWPRTMDWETPCTPLALDLDGDGDLEIITGNKELNGFFNDGTELSDGDFDESTYGPVSYYGEKFDAALSAGDVIPGGGLEVVGASWNTGEIYIWEFNAGLGSITSTVADGWPQHVVAGSGIWASPSLGDVDGDGDLEIFVVDVSGALMAWHHDGSEVADGDGNPETHGVFDTGLGVWPRGTPSFADINHDGAQEIFVPAQNGSVHGYWSDATELPGFPFVHGGEMYSSLAIDDLDQDGFPEIVFHTSNDSLYVIDHNGQRHIGWPMRLLHDNYNYWMSPSPALANVDGQPGAEIFIVSMVDNDDMDIGFIDITATWLPGWPVRTHHLSQSSPVVLDLDGDEIVEVVFCDENGEINAWHFDGQPMPGFPIIIGDAGRATPTFADLENDGSLEMIYAGWDKQLYVWQFPAASSSQNLAWYTFQHDQNRSGNTRTHDWVIGEEVAVDEGSLPPGMILLDSNYPNPFNPSTQIRFTLGEGADRRVNLGVYDARGRRLAVLVSDSLAPGSYLTRWNGLDERGNEMPSGIYFARLKVDDHVESKKMTLLK